MRIGDFIGVRDGLVCDGFSVGRCDHVTKANRHEGQLGRTGLSEADFEKALRVVAEFLLTEKHITNSALRRLSSLNYDQAIKFFKRAVDAGVLERRGQAAGTHYVSSAKSTKTK